MLGVSFRAALLFVAAALPALSQYRVDARRTHERLLCVVPMVGTGEDRDPRRPMYTPVLEDGEAPSREGIIAWVAQVSDDGNFALVEFVAYDRNAFKDILKDKQVKAFRRGRTRRADIEREFRRYKRGFDLDNFGVSVP
jgi:hypothetical protein